MPGPLRRRSHLALATLALSFVVGTWALPAEAFSAGKGAPVAPADTVTAFPDLTGSATVVTLDTSTLATLKAAGVTIGPEGAATAVDGGAAVSLPITSGYAELHSDHSFKPGFLLGSVEQFGSGLAITATATTVAVTDLVFDLGDSMVYATVGTTEDVPLFSIQRSALRARRTGDTVDVDGAVIDLTPTGAAELDSWFHTTAITPYTEIGTAAITARGRVSRYTYTAATSEIPRLSGISTSVTFAAAALKVFHRVGAVPASTGTASYDSGPGRISFPITGGTAVVHPDRRGDPGSVQGVVLQQGSGLVLTRGSTSVSMTDLTVEQGGSAVYASVNGGADDADLFSLDEAKAKVSLAGGNLHVDGAVIDMTAGAADMLNSVFATTDFKVGAELGVLDVVASGR